jgi:chromate transporter
MKSPSASLVLAAHLALLSSISFGGFPSVLPDVRNLVTANGWVTDQEFANFFAISQAVPGPNMILMMSFVGLKVGGLPGAITSALATFGPPCLMYYTSYRLWGRFRDRPWQQIVRLGLAPLTIGLVIAGGYVMARAADTGWRSAAVTAAAAALMLATRINPLWILVTGGALGGLGLLTPGE